MEDGGNKLIEKISSYNIFNNLLPGIIFCYIVEKTTRLIFQTGEVWEKFFIYYFAGMIINRIGSILVEPMLKSLKTRKKRKFLEFAPYSDYIEASENSPFIKTLNETNNTYRTFIAMMLTIMVIKICDLIGNFITIGNNIIFLIVWLVITALFIYSYKKQTDYIRERVENYISKKTKRSEIE
ncbi:hypothetical protein [Faecalibacillus intestinalis]|uniref:hypothetical protein n=1 Tax=Faecalibacillus intestinalis TaxID=1982626 RepID=UPI00295EEE85|nr:hypothetical protein [Faecalibacillus intestinalis]